MIPVAELETLESFDSNGHLVLSVYVCLDALQCQDHSYGDFIQQMTKQLAGCNARPECREAIKEDIEIVGLYLKANGHRRHAGLAMFSCAARYFWRAYPLPAAVPTRVTAGRKFDLEPLQQLMQADQRY